MSQPEQTGYSSYQIPSCKTLQTAEIFSLALIFQYETIHSELFQCSLIDLYVTLLGIKKKVIPQKINKQYCDFYH